MIPIVTFYEKTGCTTNEKQKKLLTQNGCLLDVKSLLKTNFASEELYNFLKELPITEWFNPNAPQIKNSQVNPKNYDRDSALEILISNPILIKRPLMVIGSHFLCGFDTDKVSKILGKEIGNLDNTCSIDEGCQSR